MSGTYFDAVLDENMKVYFNGTPEEVANWLVEKAREMSTVDLQIYPGKTLRPMSVDDYLQAFDNSRE